MKSEQNIQSEIMIELSKSGCLIFRNNVGALKDAFGRLVRYGVGGKGGSDLIGVCPDGKIICVEVKKHGCNPSDDQLRFIEAVRAKGGRAGVARSVEDALRILEG